MVRLAAPRRPTNMTRLFARATAQCDKQRNNAAPSQTARSLVNNNLPASPAYRRACYHFSPYCHRRMPRPTAPPAGHWRYDTAAYLYPPAHPAVDRRRGSVDDAVTVGKQRGSDAPPTATTYGERVTGRQRRACHIASLKQRKQATQWRGRRNAVALACEHLRAVANDAPQRDTSHGAH